MTATEAASLVKTLRRQLWLATLIRVLLMGIVLLGVAAAFAQPAAAKTSDPLWAAAFLAGAGWIVLAICSARQVRATNQASVYLSTGRLDLAEEQLKTALRLVSLYRAGKLLVCHNLAVVAHGQRNFAAAAELCDGVLASGVSASHRLGRLCRILLADCRLYLGDTAAAVRAIAPLNSDDPGLGLSERLMLLPIELRCQVSEGRFVQAAAALDQKVMLAGLLDSPKAALVHAMLARACGAAGQVQVAAFLMARAELYHDLGELAERYPILRDSPDDGQMADNSTERKP
ncbi:MAG: hypothetical protein ACE5F9_05000 [Phycisphaerae bacterium]